MTLQAPIYTVDDFHQKVIGRVASRASTVEILFQERGIVPKKNMYVGFGLVTSLAARQVDVIYSVYKTIEQEHLKVLGLSGRFFPITDFGMPEYEELIVVAKKGSLYAQETFCTKFQRALQKSIAFCQKHPEEAFALYIDMHPDKGPKTVLWEKASWENTYPLLAESQAFSAKKTTALLNWLYEKELIQQMLTPEDVVGAFSLEETTAIEKVEQQT